MPSAHPFSSHRITRLRVLLCSLLWLSSITNLAIGADLYAKLIPLDVEFQAKVIHITDGDTLTVLTDAKEQKKIRLNGIDCPEAGQAYGNKAKEFTKDLVAGKIVTVQAFDLDKYGRTLGDVILEDGRILNQEQVKAGLCWWYYRYSDDRELGLLELEAKLAHVGLWQDRNPVPPWVYRKIKDLLR